ncbi:MAG TPA: TrbI/VirB10 family protein [Gemmatimonadales bacterium]|nr:TrbI/VirB10 family protein [Gemmatimonadales bacterium]
MAKRLNRNALTVGAVLAGMTVLTVLVLVRPSGEPRGERPGSTLPAADEAGVPSRPSFLDEPPRAGSKLASPQGDTGSAGAPTLPPTPDADHTLGAGPAPGDTTVASLRSTTTALRRSARERTFRAALLSAAVLPTPGAGPSDAQVPDSTGRADSGALANDERQLLDLGDSVLRASTRGMSVGSVPSLAPSLSAPSAAGRHQPFLDAQGDARGQAINARLEPAGSPYTLRAGTLVPAFLITGITSDLPGDVVGQVSRDVFDSREERFLLIPKGARLIGTYDHQITAGEERLLVAWTRLIFPDGRSMRLPGLALKDAAGQTGAKDQVDTHWERAFGKALLLSAIGAGAQLSQSHQASLLASPSSGQIAAGALGQELSSVALELVRRGLDAPPTITIRAGAPFNVFLSGDLVFEQPYQAERHSLEWTAARP